MIDEKTRVSKFILSQKNGFSLIELITAIGLIGVLTLVSLSFFKPTINLQVRNFVDLDQHQLKSEIQDILGNRNHCNANFFSKPIGVNLPIDSGANGLYKCNTPTDNCITVGTPLIRFPVVSSSWEQSLSKISHQVRISDVRYTLSGSTTDCEIQSLDLSINIQSKDAYQKINNTTINKSISVVIENGVVKECYNPGKESCSQAIGQIAFTAAGVHTWTVPDGVTSVSVVAVGASGIGNVGGGGGGALAYTNNIAVNPGNTIQVTVAASAQFNPPPSSFGTYCIAGSGLIGSSSGGLGGTVVTGDGGGNGGSGGGAVANGMHLGSATYSEGGGGGAGGYLGNGGNGSSGASMLAGASGNGGSGGGGSGGFTSSSGSQATGGSGGGVGIMGLGPSGSGGVAVLTNNTPGNNGTPGSGGNVCDYGGGGAGSWNNPGAPMFSGSIGCSSGNGAVRIIWPGTTRQFPSTNTGDM